MASLADVLDEELELGPPRAVRDSAVPGTHITNEKVDMLGWIPVSCPNLCRDGESDKHLGLGLGAIAQDSGGE